MSKPSRARERKPESVSVTKPLTKLDELVRWVAVVSPGIGLSTGPAAWTATGPSHQEPQLEEIGTVRQIYDGTLYPDIQVQTFRNIERLLPTRTVQRGTHVYPLPKREPPLRGGAFTSAGKKY